MKKTAIQKYKELYKVCIMIFEILLCWNFFTFLLMAIDKWKASLRNYRISEKTLLGGTVLFGSFGICVGMIVFHHKIRKPKFFITVPIFMFIHIIIITLVTIHIYFC